MQSLTSRYHRASAHLINAANDFGRRQEPRLLAECARRFIGFDHEDRLAAGEQAAPTTTAPPETLVDDPQLEHVRLNRYDQGIREMLASHDDPPLSDSDREVHPPWSPLAPPA